MDLAALWKGRRWVTLLDYINQLPSTSRLNAAMVNDPEVAEQILAAEADASGEAAVWSPPLTEWDTQTAILAEVRDRLGEVIQAVLNTIPIEPGKSRPKYRDKPFPRPVSALDEARERLSRRAAEQIVAWFFPDASNN